MKKNYTLWILMAGLVFLFSCKPTIEEFEPSGGEADFTTYLAFGDSWSSGFADGALYKSGQEMSFPAILAGQFVKVGGGEFRQPLMLDDIGIGLGTGVPQPKLELAFRLDCKGATILAPGYATDPINMANLAPLGDPVPFNNISVPAMKSTHIAVTGYGGLNPYYGRFASSTTSKVVEEIPRTNASFFTLTLGTFDVLGYALAGGEGDPPTERPLFTATFQLALQTLMANSAKGAVANVPDIFDLPFFKTIPYNVVVLTEQAQVDGLNAAYAPLNQVIKGAGSTDTVHFALGQNPAVIQDPALPWGMRQIHADEFLLMSIPQDSLKCAGWGSMKAISPYYVMDTEEIGITASATEGYNSLITQLASDFSMALVDLKLLTADLATTGLIFDGITLNSKLVTGNFYSLDGLTPTPMGNAVVANAYIRAINNAYHANIPEVVVSDYPSVHLP